MCVYNMLHSNDREEHLQQMRGCASLHKRATGIINVLKRTQTKHDLMSGYLPGFNCVILHNYPTPDMCTIMTTCPIQTTRFIRDVRHRVLPVIVWRHQVKVSVPRLLNLL